MVQMLLSAIGIDGGGKSHLTEKKKNQHSVLTQSPSYCWLFQLSCNLNRNELKLTEINRETNFYFYFIFFRFGLSALYCPCREYCPLQHNAENKVSHLHEIILSLKPANCVVDDFYKSFETCNPYLPHSKFSLMFLLHYDQPPLYSVP